MTIGYYTSHPGGGYQPPKTDKPKAQNPPKGSGVPNTAEVETLKELTELLKNNPYGFYTIKTTTTVKPSDIELKIRKEVMEALDQIMSYDWFNMDSTLVRAKFIKIFWVEYPRIYAWLLCFASPKMKPFLNFCVKTQ